MSESESRPCCAVAKALGPQKLAELDAELLKANHAGFKKLAVVFGTNHMAVKRHKLRCLGFGAAEDEASGDSPNGPSDPGKGEQAAPGGNKGGTDAKSLGTRGNGGEQKGEHADGDSKSDEGSVPAVPWGGNSGPPVPPEELAPRPRAPVSSQARGSHEDCVLVIVARIGDGKLVPSDVPTWAKEWGRGESTVRAMVREAYLHGRVDRGTLEERRILAMGKWEFQVRLCDEALDPPAAELGKRRRSLSAMDKAMLLRERREAVTGWCKAAGVFDDSKLTVNLAVNPVFVSASEAIFASLAPFPDALAAARTALAARLQLLRQGPPMLTARSEVTKP